MELTNARNINILLKYFKDEIYLKEFEFAYNIIELGCLKKIIGEYVKREQNQKEYIIYKSKNEKNKYFTYLLIKIEDSNRYILSDLDNELKELIKKYVSIFIEIDIKYLKKVRVKILINNRISPTEYEILSKKISALYTKINKDIQDIIDSIKNRTSNQRGIIQYVGIEKREAIGFFKSKYFEFDAGKKSKYFSATGKKIKMKYIFDEYNIFTKFDNTNHRVEFTNLLSSALSQLFQMITKTPFVNSSKMEFFGESIDVSDFNKSIIFSNLEDTQFEKYINILQNIDTLIDNFFLFEPLKQNCFYRSCKSLNNALNSSGIKSLFYSYQAIENIVAYYESINEYPTNQRNENVKKLLIKYYNCKFPSEAHKFWDIYRNKYAHNGIEENELIEMAIEERFNSFNPTQLDELFINIVQTTLINILKDI